MTRHLLLALPLLAALAACDGGEGLDEDAYHWDVTISGLDDTCTDGTQYQEEMTYSLVFDGSTAALKIGQDSFAAGTTRGCDLEYESQVVGEPDRAGGAVQWVLSGFAVWRTGGDGCDMSENVTEISADYNFDWADYGAGYEASDVDWVGVETFEIVASEDEAIPVGCEYSMVVAGKYQAGQ